MLTISKPLNAEQATTYHKKEFTAPEQSYWAKDASVGEWQGSLAETIGVSGGVSSEAFSRLSQGANPVSGEQIIRHKASADYTTDKGKTVTPAEHRAGWDATFSAPKSVSLTALVGGDDRVLVAHREAVTAALTELERYTHARMGGDRAAVNTGQFLAAKFEHDTARPVDGYAAPQLHTHAVIFNMTRDATGKFRSLEPRALFDTQQFATAVYQTELTLRLRSLGYEIEKGRSGAPEIAGYTREYLDASSPRSQQIREYMEKEGVQGPAAAQIAAHNTRDSKQAKGLEEVLDAHQRLAERYGQQPQAVIAAAQGRGQTTVPQASKAAIAEAVTYAKERSFEREAVTDERMIMRDALRHGMGRLLYKDVSPEFKERVNSGEFQQWASPKYASGRLYTTPQTIRLEREAVGQTLGGKGKQEPILSQEQASLYSSTLQDLNKGQRIAVEKVLSSEDKVQGLQGFAGAGKTTTLSAIRKAAEHQGYAVQGFAPSSRATAQLAEAGIPSETLQRFLTRKESGAADPTARHLYMLDESSLASTRQMRDFLNQIGPKDRVLVIGDTRQHQAVDAGKPFEQMRDAGMSVAQLNTIVRQKNPELLKAVVKLSNGDTDAGIHLLAKQNRITEVVDKDARVKAIASAYAASPDGTLIVSPDNKSRRAINQAVRENLQEAGTLSKVETRMSTLIPRSDLTGADRKWAQNYAAGDVLRYSKGSKSLGLDSGTYATVHSVNRDTNQITVDTQQGASITYDTKRVSGATVYQSIDRSFSVGDRVQFTAPNKDLQVANRELGTITGLQDGRVSVRLDGDQKRTVSFAAKEMPHFDHGYAVTSHSSQGVTAERVLINMDTKAHPELINSRFAYVAVSRASQDAQIFTNDAEGLGRRVSREVEKTSAVEFKVQNAQKSPELSIA